MAYGTARLEYYIALDEYRAVEFLGRLGLIFVSWYLKIEI